MADHWADVRDAIASRTEARLAQLESEWAVENRRPPLSLGPRAHDPESPPQSVDVCLDLIAGIASVVVFDSEKRRETVLVYNPGGWWEPPGGVVEGGDSLAETARTEAREETGLDIVLTDLPLAQFAGRRTGGRLRVEREGRTHPGCTRAVGLFDTDTLPELRRDRKTILDLLNDPPDWSPPGES